jgi:hypothetical protein
MSAGGADDDACAYRSWPVMPSLCTSALASPRVRTPSLAHDRRYVVADRPLGEEQALGDRGVAQTLA